MEKHPIEIIKQFEKDIKGYYKKKKSKGAFHIHSEAELDNAKNILDYMKDHKKGPMSWKTAQQKFYTSMGIEYTFLKRHNTKKTEIDIINEILKIVDKRNSWNKKIHKDGENVIEYASPSHSNWQDMLSNYREILKIAKQVGLVLSRHDEGGGGGHIHMGIPKSWTTKRRLEFINTMYLDISSRPYLNWMFNDVEDDKNACSMLTSPRGVKFLSEAVNRTHFDLNFSDWESKNFALRFCPYYDTMELRFFGMPKNETMLREHVEFANAYYRYIACTAKWTITSQTLGYYSINNTTLDKFRDRKTAIAEFNKLLKTLGLNPAVYKKYIKNYDARLALNKRGELKMDYDKLANIKFPVNLESGESQYIIPEEPAVENTAVATEGMEIAETIAPIEIVTTPEFTNLELVEQALEHVGSLSIVNLKATLEVLAAQIKTERLEDLQVLNTDDVFEEITIGEQPNGNLFNTEQLQITGHS